MGEAFTERRRCKKYLDACFMGVIVLLTIGLHLESI